MEKSLARVDGVLIDKVCQPLVDWLSQHLSIDCFRVARVCTDLSALAWILSQVPGLSAMAKNGALGPELFQFGLIVFGLGAIMVLRVLFERAGGTGSGRTGGVGNPFRTGMFTHRLTCLVWLTGLLVKTAILPIGFGPLALLAVAGFATVAVYVGSCSNRPPKQQRFSKRRTRGLASRLTPNHA